MQARQHNKPGISRALSLLQQPSHGASVHRPRPTYPRPRTVRAQAQHLLHAADHYELPRLLAICCAALRASLTVENAALTLTLADQHCHGAPCPAP